MKFVPHASAPSCAQAIAALGRKTGAFETTIMDNIWQFSAEKLQTYDALVLANVYLGQNKFFSAGQDNERDRPLIEARRKALLDFVRGGKGLVALHNASNPALGWPEYNEMLGGTDMAHAWWSHQGVPLRVEDTASPLTAAMTGQPLVIEDDIYMFAAPYARDRVRVLLSVDAAKAPASMTAERPDRDYPVSWVKKYGQGRVFYTALGHRAETFQNPLFLRHVLDGIQFATGDLVCDTSPGKPLPADPAFTTMQGWQPLFDGKDLSAWQVSDVQNQHWLVGSDGILHYDGQAPTLRTKESFGDYMLRVDFRLPRTADSGVFVRNDLQLNIWTWSMGSGEMYEHRCAAKTEEARKPYIPRTREDRAVGEWNSFLITVQDDKVSASLNGREILFSAPLMVTGKRSPIGLQQHGDPVDFKAIYVKPLPAQKP
jgi:type 1 glutamine amidotransferase